MVLHRKKKKQVILQDYYNLEKESKKWPRVSFINILKRQRTFLKIPRSTLRKILKEKDQVNEAIAETKPNINI